MLTKELVDTFVYDDVYTNRSAQETFIVKGRTYIKIGTKCASVFVGVLNKVFDTEAGKYKYILSVGHFRQGKSQFVVSYDDFVEDAVFNAYIDPISTLVLDRPINQEQFESYCESIKNMIPIEFLLTDEEMKA